jgi:hypothetical protein
VSVTSANCGQNSVQLEGSLAGLIPPYFPRRPFRASREGGCARFSTRLFYAMFATIGCGVMPSRAAPRRSRLAAPRSRNRPVKPQARPYGEHGNGDDAPHQRDSNQAGEETHRPDCPCHRNRDQQRTEYDHREAGGHSDLVHYFHELGEGAWLAVFLSRARNGLNLLIKTSN